MGGFFATELYAEHKTFGYHKTVFEKRNPAFWVGAVVCSPLSGFVLKIVPIVTI